MVEEFNLRPHGSVVVSARAIDSQELLKFTRSHTQKKKQGEEKVVVASEYCTPQEFEDTCLIGSFSLQTGL